MKHIPYATQTITDEDIEAVDQVLRSDFLTQGPKIAEFEKKVSEYCGAHYAVAVSSGTAALHGACFAAGIGPGHEVITSPITFVATANCILYCSGNPVFSDILEDTVNIDPQDIEVKITNKTKAIIPVHFAGHPADLEEIQSIARKHNLIIIEDAAHALGAEYKGSKIGSCKYSDMAVLSFHAVKHITTGEGGMVLTNSKKYYQKLLMFRTHGITREKALLEKQGEGDWYYEMHHLGFNNRLTDFQAALGLSQLAKLGDFIKRRQAIAARYEKAFSGLSGIRTIKIKPCCAPAWHIYPIVVSSLRKEVFDKLKQNGIGVNVHYIPVYLQPYYRKLGYQPGLCPKAEDYYRGAITLPLYPKMSDGDVDYVIACVKGALK